MAHFLLKNYWKNIFQFIFFLAFFIQNTNGQVKFTATANETQIGKNELVQIQFKIENAQSIRSIEPPSFDNFAVVSGPNQETGSFSNNGNRSFYAAISFILKPLKTGKLHIGTATAIADGKQITSNPLTISVTSSGSGKAQTPVQTTPGPFAGLGLGFDVPTNPTINEDYILKPGENIQEKIKKNLFVRLEANKTSCFVGEPVVVSFKLYTRLLSKTNITEAPSFNGFSVTDMDVSENGSVEKIHGQKYNCYTLRKVQLFPTRPGNYNITPLQSINRVNFVKPDKHERRQAEDDPFMQLLQDIGAQSFSSGGMIEESVPMTSNSLTINVKPLPEKNKPENFRGAVGHFSVKCSLQKEKITTDDAGNLSLTISGAGNLAFINAPEIHWPKDVDVYDAKTKEQIDNQQVPLAGSKTFNIPFTVSKAGNYNLPPVHFSWFNPILEKYDSSVTEPISFLVSQGNRGLSLHNKAIKSLSGKSFITISGLEWLGGIGLVAGLTVLLLFVFFRKKNRETELEAQIRLDDLKNEQQTKEFVIPGNPLEKVHNKLQEEDSDGFYRELELSLRKYLSQKFKIPMYELSNETILEAMDKCNIGIGTTRLFESLVREIELALYAKSSHAGQMRNLYEKSAELIALIDKQICA